MYIYILLRRNVYIFFGGDARAINQPLTERRLAARTADREEQAFAALVGWWHIYLDNFFSGQKVKEKENASDGDGLHQSAERVWEATGVLSSKKKKVSSSKEAEELGGKFSSSCKYLGVSGERLLKVCQTTLVTSSKRFLPTKWLQVVCGRWVHVLQFRRAGMIALHDVWKLISGSRKSSQDLRARGELITMIQGSCCFIPTWELVRVKGPQPLMPRQRGVQLVKVGAS